MNNKRENKYISRTKIGGPGARRRKESKKEKEDRECLLLSKRRAT
jgi:hypothetical protein